MKCDFTAWETVICVVRRWVHDHNRVPSVGPAFGEACVIADLTVVRSVRSGAEVVALRLVGWGDSKFNAAWFRRPFNFKKLLDAEVPA